MLRMIRQVTGIYLDNRGDVERQYICVTLYVILFLGRSTYLYFLGKHSTFNMLDSMDMMHKAKMVPLPFFLLPSFHVRGTEVEHLVVLLVVTLTNFNFRVSSV